VNRRNPCSSARVRPLTHGVQATRKALNPGLGWFGWLRARTIRSLEVSSARAPERPARARVRLDLAAGSTRAGSSSIAARPARSWSPAQRSRSTRSTTAPTRYPDLERSSFRLGRPTEISNRPVFRWVDPPKSRTVPFSDGSTHRDLGPSRFRMGRPTEISDRPVFGWVDPPRSRTVSFSDGSTHRDLEPSWCRP